MTSSSRPGEPGRGRPTVLRWVRLVAVLGIGLGVVAPLLLFFAALTFAGARFGWVPSTAAFVGLGLLIGWAAVSRDWAQARRATLIVLAAVGGVVGMLTAHFAPPTPGRLRHEIEAFVPSGWTLMHESVNGNALCFDYCTSVSRTYLVGRDLGDVVGDLTPLLANRCSRPLPEIDPTTWTCPGGDIDLRVEAARRGDGSTVVYVRADS
jgi:hypothetical protein